jgi:hypothetical protein
MFFPFQGGPFDSIEIERFYLTLHGVPLPARQAGTGRVGSI